MTLVLKTRKNTGNNYVCIDADSICYSIGFAAQKTYYNYEDKRMFETKKEMQDWLIDNGLEWHDDKVSTHIKVEPIENVLHSVKVFIQGIIDATEAGRWDIFLSGENNFRDSVVSYYKANRTAAKPLVYQEIRDYLQRTWKATLAHGCEADDLVSIELWKAYKEGRNNVIAACIDKDIKNTPGRFYNFNTGEFSSVTLEQANYNLMKQCLTGDYSVDHVIGCGKEVKKVWKSGKRKGQEYTAREGIGPKQAEKILAHCETLDEMLCAVGLQYALMFDDPEDKLWEQMSLLHMLREPLGTFQPGEEILGPLYDRQTKV